MTERGASLVLIGFMGAGKSSAGRRLEKRTGWKRFDTDEMIAAHFGLPILEIFRRHGEEAFRETESALLEQLKPQTTSIVVTGGGILLREKNADRLRALGRLIYLRADEETLFLRATRRGTRPLLQSEDPRKTLRDLLQLRAPLYEKYADITLDTTDLDHDAVTDLILRTIAPNE